MSTSSIATKQPVGVVVKDVVGTRSAYRDALGYHIDEDGVLHVRGAKGNVASYARGCWTFAAIATEVTP